MSGFISSAVSGRKVAPKAAGRRRPAPVVSTRPYTVTASDAAQAAPTEDESSSTLQEDASRRTRQLTPPSTLPAVSENDTSAIPQSTDVTARYDAENVGQATGSSSSKRPHESDQSSAEQPRKKVSYDVRGEIAGHEPVTQPLANHGFDHSVHAPQSDLPTPPSTQMIPPQAVMQVVPTADSDQVADQHSPQEASPIHNDEPATRGRPHQGTTVRGRRPKASKDKTAQDNGGSGAGVDDDVGAVTKTKRTRTRKNKELTDADGSSVRTDPETHEIDPSRLSMFELSHEGKYGKVSEREKKMASIDWKEVARKRRDAVERIIQGGGTVEPGAEQSIETSKDIAAGVSDVVDEDDEGVTSADTPAAPEKIALAKTSGGLRFRMVNGQIVEDEDTLAIDRQADAEASALNNEPVEEDNDLTARINRATWVNARRRDPTDRVPAWRAKSDPWTDADTDKFYDALRMFGTDFFIISKMFPPKTRRQIKTKFTREEKIDPARVDAALMGKQTKSMDLEHYARESGRDVSAYTRYDSYEHAKEVIRESLKEKEELYEQAMREEMENARQENIQREQRRVVAEQRKNQRKGKRMKMGGGTLGGGQADDG